MLVIRPTSHGASRPLPRIIRPFPLWPSSSSLWSSLCSLWPSPSSLWRQTLLPLPILLLPLTIRPALLPHTSSRGVGLQQAANSSQGQILRHCFSVRKIRIVSKGRTPGLARHIGVIYNGKMRSPGKQTIIKNMNSRRPNCLQRSSKTFVFDQYQLITSVNNCLRLVLLSSQDPEWLLLSKWISGISLKQSCKVVIFSLNSIKAHSESSFWSIWSTFTWRYLLLKLLGV